MGHCFGLAPCRKAIDLEFPAVLSTMVTVSVFEKVHSPIVSGGSLGTDGF